MCGLQPADRGFSLSAHLVMSPAPVIQVRDLHFRYEDGTVALVGVDFDLGPGETVALLGANGSGKTTFVLHLNGLLEGRGQIEVCGLPLKKETLQQIRQKIGIVFQDPDDQLFMPSVLEDVAFGPLNLGLTPEQATDRARTALAQVGMVDSYDKAPYHLSAGQKKRVAIAGVLAMQPDVLVLDEPTTFLDPPGQHSLTKLLQGLPQSKLVVTHDVEFARSLATRAVFFEKGRIVGNGPADRIIEQYHWDQKRTTQVGGR
jgi:cobalt/nickel transport system ATP-binding protein